MSEYQFYEFQAIDKPLSKEQQDNLRELSSRAKVNARSASFVYSYSDFSGDVKALMWECFDAMIYLANWGSRRLLLRFPVTSVDVKALEAYAVEYLIEISLNADKLLLDINIEEVESDDWLEGEGVLASLLELREEIQRGDLRTLYLVWLKAYDEHYDDDYGELIVSDATLEPPIPAGLNELSDAHRAFIEFFDIDENLVAAAAQASPSLSANTELPPLDQIENLLDGILASAKTRLLQAVQHGELTTIALDVGQALRVALCDKTNVIQGQRTVKQLETLAEEVAKQRVEQERQQKQAEQIRKLEELAPKEPMVWRHVEELCERKTSSAYNQAVDLLCQLKALAQYKGTSFDSRFAPLLERWQTRKALITRLQEKGLIK